MFDHIPSIPGTTLRTSLAGSVGDDTPRQAGATHQLAALHQIGTRCRLHSTDSHGPINTPHNSARAMRCGTMTCKVSFAAVALLFLQCTTTSLSFITERISLGRFATSCHLARRKVTNEEDDQLPMDSAKRAALDGVLNQIERTYGRGSVVKLGDAENMVVDCIGSGAPTLDAALGGGYPKGKLKCYSQH